ncbi:hypothetical protein BDA99DRAFT_504586 [Phascolomyces articulosus]|uniref:F-box domain-containing protein n=1 Tax=Phascolomyces articulosus TaxID=60185 RepID=A0AAD5K3S7_9FUNG|nr:hypothetical protein BDA99DRAFT_504586 [Phascolomyces articulosus]
MNKSILPIQPTHLGLFEQRFQQIQNTLNNGTHHQLIQDVTTAIDDVFQSQLLVLLDIRAYAHAMQGHYKLACTDAQQMIEYAPRVPTGYIRQGIIYSMYGRQTQAIEIFDRCLELPVVNYISDRKLNKDSGQQQLQNENDMERLLACKNEAILLNQKRVDFIAQLPIEIINDIIPLLPKSTKVSCMRVSKIYCYRTLNCAGAWKTLSANESREDSQIAVMMESISGHIEKLRINTPNKAVCSKYLQCMRNGLFKRIRSLTMTGCCTGDLRSSAFVLSTALWQARSTLRYFEIHIDDDFNKVTLTDILLVCSNITDLTYIAHNTLVDLRDQDLIGLHNENLPLASLEVKSSNITKQTVKTILQRYIQLRRLVINGCDSSVIDSIDQYATENLEILGYNTRNVPTLQSQQQQQLSLPPSPPLDDYTQNQDIKQMDVTRGLRKIIAMNNDQGRMVHTSTFFPIIYKNRKSIETISISLTDLIRDEVQDINSAYPDFRLNRLTDITFWPTPRLQRLLLQSIPSTITTLKHVTIRYSEDASDIYRMLLRLPPLETLRILSVDTTGLEKQCLVELFERYAQLSESSHGSVSLKTVSLWHGDLVDDTVLSVLGDIKTLHHVTLWDLHSVTTQGLQDLMKKLYNQLTCIDIKAMSAVTDIVVAELGGSDTLTTIGLDGLPKVTNQGIRALIDKKVSNPKLSSLTITNCSSVTDECIQYVKHKVDAVVHG